MEAFPNQNVKELQMKKAFLVVMVFLSLLSFDGVFASSERELDDAITDLWLKGADVRIERVLTTWASSSEKELSHKARFHLLCLKVLRGDFESANKLLEKLELSAETGEEKEYVSKLRGILAMRENRYTSDQQAGGKFSIDVKDRDIRSIAEDISKKAGIDLIVSQDVQGSADLHLEDVTLWQALESLTASANLTWVRRDGAILINTVGQENNYVRKKMVLSHTDPRNARKILEPFFFENMFRVFFSQKGNILFLEGPSELIEDMIKTMEWHDRNAVSIIKRGSELMGKKRYEDAIESYKEAAGIATDNPVSWNNMAGLFEEQGNYEEAIKCYDKVLEIEPNDCYALVGKGALLRYKARFDEALECLDAAISLEPDNSEAWLIKAEVFEEQARFIEALNCYDKSLENVKTGFTLAKKAECLIKMQKYEDALVCFDEAIRVGPDELPQFWSGKAKILAKQSRYDEAIKCHERATELYPQYYGNFLEKGKLYFKLKRFEDAIKMYNHALSLEPDLHEARKLQKEATWMIENE